MPFTLHMHEPLARVWHMLWWASGWSAAVASFAAATLFLTARLEAAVLPAYPLPHNLGLWAVCIPVAGTLLATFLTRQWPRTGVLADLLLIVSSMPAGVEGAAMRLGATAAPARYFSGAEKELLLACGVTAGFAGMFGTPVAAVIFTWVFITKRRAGFIVLAALVGSAMHWLITGRVPGFSWQGSLPATVQPLGLYMLLGALAGLAAAAIVRAVQAMQYATDRWKFGWWPVVAAAIAGAIAWYRPDAYGQGFERTALIVHVKNITIVLLVAMSGYKMIAFSMAKGARMPGSIISPVLAMGAAFGLLTALLLQLCFPHIAIHPPTAALIGAAALLAGTTRGCVWAIVLCIELTGRLEALLPAAAACLAAYAVSAVFLRKNIVARSGRG